MGNLVNKNRFSLAKCQNWLENGKWTTVISITGTNISTIKLGMHRPQVGVRLVSYNHYHSAKVRVCVVCVCVCVCVCVSVCASVFTPLRP